MEPESLLPCLQASANGLCPESDKSRPHLHKCNYKINLDIILPFTPRSPKWSFLFRFFDSNGVCISHILCVLHAHTFILLGLTTLIIFCEVYNLGRSSLCEFCPFSCYFVSLRSKYFSRRCALRHPQPMFFP